ncbi:MAG: hypothetical protein SGARI_003550 [Bacillariaceae sp.]
MNNSSDELTLGDNNGLYHESCRIVLPFMNGLDSEDEFELEEDVDESDEGRIPASMDDWFNSNGDLAFSFDSFRAEEDFADENFETPRRNKNTEDCQDLEGDAEHFERSFNMKTPSDDSFPSLPVVEDIHKTPVISNLHANFPDLDSTDDPQLPTLTPVPGKGSPCQGHVNKESPTSVMEMNEAFCDPKAGVVEVSPQDSDDFSLEIDQCTERMSSIKLASEDILAQDAP